MAIIKKKSALRPVHIATELALWPEPVFKKNAARDR